MSALFSFIALIVIITLSCMGIAREAIAMAYAAWELFENKSGEVDREKQ